MRQMIMLAAITAGCAVVPTALDSRDASDCPCYLPDGAYEFSHLIVPLNNSDIAIGHSDFATVTPNNYATIFNFDVLQSRANQQCAFYFTLPRHDQLTTSNFKWSGSDFSGETVGTLKLVQFAHNTGATDQTTGSSQPSLGPDPEVELNDVVASNSYKAWSGSCGNGGVMSWGSSSSDNSLNYFQDWNICANGLWVVCEEALAAPGLAAIDV